MYNVGALKPDLAPTFRVIAEKDMAFTMRLIITKLSVPVQADVQKAVNAAVDAPTPWTQKSVQRRPITGGRPVFNGVPLRTPFVYEVFLPDEAARGGTPAGEYLGPNIHGGTRGFKGSEKALNREGILGAGAYAYPGLAAKRDAYGNMSRGQTIQVLSYLRAAESKAGYTANMSAKRKAGLNKGSEKKGIRGIAYFVSVGKGKAGRFNRPHHLPAGIWERTSFGKLGSAIKPVLIFGKAPTYQKRIPFYETVNATLSREVGPQTNAAIVDVMTKYAGKGR